jgi:tetratricopeptide (TPR) repeat protein
MKFLGIIVCASLALVNTAEAKSHTKASKHHKAEKSDAIAREALGLFDKELTLLGLEKLFSLKNPSQISPEVASAWRERVPADLVQLREVQVSLNPGWESVFSKESFANIQAWQIHDLKSENDFKQADILVRKLKTSSNEWAWVVWQMAIGHALQNKTEIAIDELQTLLDSDQKLVSDDEVLMTAGRLKFQDQKFDEALKYYKGVSKSSDFWLESLEEQAWSRLRQNDYEKALGSFHTLMAPVFAPQVGPEAYLIGSFSDLKICDYNATFDALKGFKNKYKDKTTELEELAKTGNSPAVESALKKLSQGPTSWASLGSDVKKLPMFFNRDVPTLRALDKFNSYTIEAAKARAAKELAVATSADAKAASTRGQISKRIMTLAQNDLNGLSKIVQKLHIVEVEAIQRMGVTQKTAAKTSRDSDESINDQVRFPKENEVWLDEVSHYQVQAKGCQAAHGGKSL